MGIDAPICICGKKSYDKRTAQTLRNLRGKHRGVKLRIYQCDQEDVWHLTKSL